MSDPTTKAELLDRISGEHAHLEQTLAHLSEAQLTQSGVTGEWSAKDVLAHLTAWEQYAIRRLQAAANHDTSTIHLFGPDEPTDTDELNARIFAHNQPRSLAQVQAAFQQSYHALLKTLADFSEADLFAEDGVVHPLLGMLAGNTYEHYPEHSAMLRAWREAHT